MASGAIAAGTAAGTVAGAATPATHRAAGELAGAMDPAGLEQQLAHLQLPSSATSAFHAVPGGQQVTTPGGLTAAVADGTGALQVHAGSDGWTLTPVDVGRSGNTDTVSAGAPTTSGGTVHQGLGPLAAWYKTDAGGVEQGFTVGQPPAGSGDLVIELRSSGDLRPSLQSATAVDLRSAAGRTALVYGGLKVTDAKGDAVPSHFTVSGDDIGIVADAASSAYPLTVDPYVQQGEFTADTPDSGESFGQDVSVDAAGTTAVVGAPFYCETDPISDCQGQVYVFTYKDTAWTQTTVLVPAASDTDDDVPTTAVTEIGDAVAISGDGKTMAVTQDFALDDDAVTWQVRVLMYYLVVTGPDRSWVYGGTADGPKGPTLDVNTGNFEPPLLSLSLDAAGTTLAIGNPVAQGDDTSLWPRHTVTESGQVDLVDTTFEAATDGEYPLTEALSDPAYDPYHCTGSVTTVDSRTYCGNGSYYTSGFGSAVALSGNGQHLLVNETSVSGTPLGYTVSNRVYAYQDNGHPSTPWDTTPDELTGSDVPDTYYDNADCTITPPDTYCGERESFGFSVALTATGTTAVVGDPGHFFGQGSVYVFKDLGGNSFAQKAELFDSDGVAGAALGVSVATTASGSTVVTGAPDVVVPTEENLGVPSVTSPTGPGLGQADVFDAPKGGWTGQQNQNQVLTPADGETGDSFGTFVGIAGSGGSVLVGAPFFFSYQLHEELPPGAAYRFLLQQPTSTTLTVATTATKKALPTVAGGALQATTDQDLTLTATVTPAPTDTGGKVAFTENGNPLTGCTTAPVDGAGTATCTVPKTTATTVGKDPDVFAAKFSGTTHFDASTSSPLDVIVVPKLDITTDDLPNVTSGDTIAVPLDADGGVGAYTWSLPKGAKPLPGTLQVFSDGEVAGQVPTETKKTTIKFKVVVTDQSPSPQTDTQTLTLTVTPAAGPALAITTASLPDAVVTHSYSATLAATGGQTPYSWSVVGSLPPGLSINKTSGKIGGTPSAKGTYTFTVTVKGAHTSSTATKTFHLLVGALVITTASPPTAELTKPYRYTLAAAGGTGSYTWAVVTGWHMPTGLTLDKTTGEISGKVTVNTGMGFDVRVTDGAGQTVTAFEDIVVQTTLDIVSEFPWPDGDAGTHYSLQLVADGGTGSYTWTVTGSGKLPTGLTLQATGLLSGTLTTTDRGFSTFVAKVTDGASQSKTVDVSIDVFAPMRLSPTTASIAADLGKSFNSEQASDDGLVQPTGGDTYAYTWSVSHGSLPPGIEVQGTSYGVLKGTPTSLGTYTFTLTVTDGTGGSVTEAVTFTVDQPPTITTGTLPAGTVGTRYPGQLVATGGSAPEHWTTVSGNVPGIGITYTSGKFNGAPSTAGTYAVTYQVTDRAGATATRSYTITVGGPPSAPQQVTATASPVVADQVDVTWTAPASDGGTPITSYQVYAEDDLTAEVSGPVVVTAPPGGALATSATISGLTAGQPYFVYVTASNANGIGTRGTTGSYQVIPTATVPASTDLAVSTTSTGAARAALGTAGQPGYFAALGDYGTGKVTVSSYGADPVPVTPGNGLFYDARVSAGSTFTGKTIVYHTAGRGTGEVEDRALTVVVCGVSDGEQVEWWVPDTQQFEPVPYQSAPQGPGSCVTIIPRTATTLDGTVFFVPAPPASPAAGQWSVATPQDYEPQTAVTPNVTSSVLDLVSCPSTTFCLAGGQSYVNSGLPELMAVDGDGVETDVAADLPATTGPIDAVSCSSDSHCVVLAAAVGATGSDTHDARATWILTMNGTPASPSSWTKVAMPALPIPTSTTPEISYPSTRVRYYSTRTLSCPTATWCTTVGSEYAIYQETIPGNPSFTEGNISPMVLTLSGGTWTAKFLTGPATLTSYYDTTATDSYLDALSCPAVRTCVAVGGYASGHSGTTGHEWDEILTPTAGTTWKQGPTPVDSGPPSGHGGFTYLRGLSCVSQTHCVADGFGAWHTTGTKATTGQGVVETLTHGTWTYEDMPWVGLLQAVSCTSPSACVAVGSLDEGQTTVTGHNGVTGPLIAVLSGTTWSLAPATGGTDTGGTLQDVASPAGGDGVAVGSTPYHSLLMYRLTVAPTVTSVTPASGPVAGGTRVVITGTDFYQSTVFDFGTGRAATDVICQSTTRCTARTPAGTAPGTVPVTAANGTLSSSAVGAPTYRYLAPAPTVTKVTADLGLVSGGTAVTVTGTGFSTTATATAFTFGPHRAATTVSCPSTTSCTLKTPADTVQTVDVVATVGGQSSATSPADHYTYTTNLRPATTTPAPTLTKVTPATGTTAGGTTVTLTGTGFSTAATATTVTFGSGHHGTDVSCPSATSCTARTPAGSAGAVTVTVTVGGKTSATTGAPTFTYVTPPPPAPTLTKVTPATGTTAGGTTVTLTGTGFSTAATATTVTFGSGKAGKTVACASANSCTARTPAGSAGPVTVTVTVGGKTSVTTGAPTFTYLAPRNTPPPPTTTTTTVPVPPPAPPNARRGYWDVAADGGVFAYGTDPFLGSLPGLGVVVDDVTGLSATADGEGYWLVGADGGVYAFGSAGFYGSLPALGVVPVAPIVGIAATPDGRGYWLVGADGGVYAFGDAAFYGSLPAVGMTPHAPIVGIAAAPGGKGYWLVGADGGVYAFGSAGFYGSLPALHLVPRGAITGMAATADGGGYWLVGSDGGVYAFGDAPFDGSAVGDDQAPAVGIAPTVSGRGYWVAESNGATAAFGDAPPEALPAGRRLNAPMVGEGD